MSTFNSCLKQSFILLFFQIQKLMDFFQLNFCNYYFFPRIDRLIYEIFVLFCNSDHMTESLGPIADINRYFKYL